MKKISIIAPLIVIGMAATAQERQFAVTEFSANYLRTAPDYESALETQELMGTVTEVVGQKGYWRQVVTPQPYTAWCTDLGLALMTEKEIAAYIAAPKYIVTSLYGHVFTEPDAGSQPVCDLVAGDLLRMAEDKASSCNEACSADEENCCRNKSEWLKVMLPSGKTGFVCMDDVQDFRDWAGDSEATVENIIGTAKKFTGVPYLWGGMSSKGLDCSGLTRLTWLLNGVLLPRNASQQVKTGDRVAVDPDPSFGPNSEGLREEMLRRVRNLKRGDLVFFGTPDVKDARTGAVRDRITHVGMYIGDHRIIHASHTVRINSLIPGDSDYYENAHRLIRARRVIGREDKDKGIISILNSPAYFPVK